DSNHTSYAVLDLLTTFNTCTIFFQCSGPHRDLHSFPTRRSSDLSNEVPWHGRPPDAWQAAANLQRRLAHGVQGCGAAEPAQLRRSEEHTSELQSRGQLVCRLLLEKNNRRRSRRFRPPSRRAAGFP